MTKEQYFEMCQVLGTTPLDEEIPIEYEDLPLEVQEAFDIYYRLQDNWDAMSGTYFGKMMNGIVDIFDIYEIESNERKLLLTLIGVIDKHRSELITTKKNSKKPPE